MTITSIGLKNFQSIAEYQEIPISDITLFFGPNSAGKSAVIDAMEILKEIIDKGGEDFFGGLNNDRLRKSIRRASENNFDKDDWRVLVRVDFELSQFISGEDQKILSEAGVTGWDHKHLEVTFVLNGTGGRVPSVEVLINRKTLFAYQKTLRINVESALVKFKGVLKDIHSRSSLFAKAIECARNDSKHFSIDEFGILECRMPFYTAYRNFGEICVDYGYLYDQDELSDEVSPEEWVAFAELADEYNGLLGEIKRAISVSLDFHRVPASRTVPTTEDLKYFLRPAAFMYGHRLLSEMEEIFNGESDRRYVDLAVGLYMKRIGFSQAALSDHYINIADHVNSILRDHLFLDKSYQIEADVTFMLPFEEAKAENIDWSEKPAIVRLNLVDSRGNKFDFNDVGSGVGYSLPVIMATSKNCTSYIEQPELHIHPALQAAMADVFIESIKLSSKRLFIETHSEHMILRILKRIRQTTNKRIASPSLQLSPGQVSVLYFEPSLESGTRVRQLRITPDGDFMDKWPGGFFSEREGELFDE